MAGYGQYRFSSYALCPVNCPDIDLSYRSFVGSWLLSYLVTKPVYVSTFIFYL